VVWLAGGTAKGVHHSRIAVIDMPSPASPSSLSSFDSWLELPQPLRRRGRSAAGPRPGGLRFAFYGRISTVEYQDPVSSRAWQVEAAGRVIAGRGRIVVEFFDAGSSRSLPWARRPQAAALLAAAQDPDRGFDAVVVGEFERAFAGGEAQVVIALLATGPTPTPPAGQATMVAGTSAGCSAVRWRRAPSRKSCRSAGASRASTSTPYVSALRRSAPRVSPVEGTDGCSWPSLDRPSVPWQLTAVPAPGRTERGP